MPDTNPMVTPRNFTGEPTSSPWTDSLKYVWYCTASFFMLHAPRVISVTTTAAMARRTKRPSLK
jgi:hypothetical protein